MRISKLQSQVKFNEVIAEHTGWSWLRIRCFDIHGTGAAKPSQAPPMICRVVQYGLGGNSASPLYEGRPHRGVIRGEGRVIRYRFRSPIAS